MKKVSISKVLVGFASLISIMSLVACSSSSGGGSAAVSAQVEAPAYVSDLSAELAAIAASDLCDQLNLSVAGKFNKYDVYPDEDGKLLVYPLACAVDDNAKMHTPATEPDFFTAADANGTAFLAADDNEADGIFKATSTHADSAIVAGDASAQKYKDKTYPSYTGTIVFLAK